jgi:hypothetical protein
MVFSYNILWLLTLPGQENMKYVVVDIDLVCLQEMRQLIYSPGGALSRPRIFRQQEIK